MDPPGWTQMRNIELEKYELMNYAFYNPGTIAGLTSTQPSASAFVGSENLNQLSSFISSFNTWLKSHYLLRANEKIAEFTSRASKLQ